LIATVATACPDENALVRFARGTSDDGELAMVEAHLDGCDECRRAVAAAATDETLPAAAAPAVLEAGAKLGRYEVERLLGVGGMGVVYVGRDPRLGRRVALKRLHGATHADAHARLEREAQAMAQLSHPNVVPIFELGDDDSGVFFAMELVDGVTLRDWLKTPRSADDVLARFLEAGRGLEAAHAAGVVHRDFKPANVLVGLDGRARVTDFGLARPLGGAPVPSGDANLTQDGALLGTLAYMSPEQLRGEPADARSDQFSFCLALAEALGGASLFEGKRPEARLSAMARPPALGVRIPGRLRAALARGLALDPAARFLSMRELLSALEGARHPRRTVTWVAAGVGLALVAVAGVLALRPPAPQVDLEQRLITLLPGQVVGVDTGGVATVTTSDEAIAEVTSSPTGFAVRGVSRGSACVVVHGEDTERRFTVNVGSAIGMPCAQPERTAGPTTLAAAPPPAAGTIVVAVGEKTLMWIPGLERIAVGDADFADVVVGREKGVLEVVGVAPGETSLIVWSGDESRNWRVSVVPAP
jgi:predicted Ser/Thr protein kinase